MASVASPGSQTVGQLIDSSIRQTVLDMRAAMTSPVTTRVMAPAMTPVLAGGQYPVYAQHGQYPVVEREYIKEVPKEVIKYVDRPVVKEVPTEVVKVPRFFLMCPCKTKD